MAHVAYISEMTFFSRNIYTNKLQGVVTLGGAYDAWSLRLGGDMASVKREPGLERSSSKMLQFQDTQ